jgi:hypothetical protein
MCGGWGAHAAWQHSRFHTEDAEGWRSAKEAQWHHCMLVDARSGNPTALRASYIFSGAA